MRRQDVFYEYLKEGRLLTRDEEKGRFCRLPPNTGENWIYLEAINQSTDQLKIELPNFPVMFFDLSLLDTYQENFYANYGWSYGKLLRSTAFSHNIDSMELFFERLNQKSGDFLSNELLFERSISLKFLKKCMSQPVCIKKR